MPSALGSDATSITLVIEIENVRSQGDVLVALFDRRAAWLDDARAVRKVVLPAPTSDASSVRWILEDLPAGDYAARAYQDLDGDGELDKNRIGLPNEPFGFSNDAKPRLGPPGWGRARFEVATRTRMPVRFELRGGPKEAEDIARAYEDRFGKVERENPEPPR